MGETPMNSAFPETVPPGPAPKVDLPELLARLAEDAATCAEALRETPGALDAMRRARVHTSASGRVEAGDPH